MFSNRSQRRVIVVLVALVTGSMVLALISLAIGPY
jgi:hypothetical protein